MGLLVVEEHVGTLVGVAVGIALDVFGDANVRGAGVVASADILVEVVLADLAGLAVGKCGAGNGVSRVGRVDENGEGVGFSIDAALARDLARWSIDLLDAESPLAEGPAVVAADAFADGKARELAMVRDLEADVLAGHARLVERRDPVVAGDVSIASGTEGRADVGGTVAGTDLFAAGVGVDAFDGVWGEGNRSG